jgi:hypothetical protein
LRFILLVEVFYFRFNVILFRFCFWIFLSIALAARDGHFYGHATFTKKFLFIDFKLWTICRKKEKKVSFSFEETFLNRFSCFLKFFSSEIRRQSAFACWEATTHYLAKEKKIVQDKKKLFFCRQRKNSKTKKFRELLKRPNEFLSD